MTAKAAEFAERLAVHRQVSGRSTESRWCVLHHAAGVIGAEDWRAMQVPA